MVSVLSVVIDDASSVTARNGYLDIDGVWVTPLSVTEADLLAEQAGKLAAQMRAMETARKVTDPEPNGPLALPEAESRAMWGDR